MKINTKRRIRVPCQILYPRTSTNVSTSNCATSRPRNNSDFMLNSPMSRFSLQPNSSRLTNVMTNDIFDMATTLNESREGLNCINSNNWNLVRNLSNLNINNKKPTVQIKLPKQNFISKKVIKPLIHIKSPESVSKSESKKNRVIITKRRVRPGLLLDRIVKIQRTDKGKENIDKGNIYNQFD